MKPATSPLLLEVGCEEIPARFLWDAQRQLGERLNTALREARLGTITDSQTFSTPRRLTAFVPALLTTQPDRREEVLGPPARIAFDQDGNTTGVAQSFAAKNNAGVPDLVRVTTAKGDYLAIRRIVPGRPASELLPQILAEVVTGINFPKSMYWTAKSGPRFVRPIRWILALFGQGKLAAVVSFEIAGVQSSNVTYGHRLNGRKGTAVRSFTQYRSVLVRRRVEIDRETRRQSVRRDIKVLLDNSSSSAIEDRDLEEWLVNSTEWPHALPGSFEERFLRLPREILITVMRDHQKYFAVEGSDGKLQPRFIAVLNVDGDPKGLIRAGHERVLTARFSDAEFFWNADQKIPLAERRPMLEKVTYQVKLGSYGDKVRRMGVIAEKICFFLAGLAGQSNLAGEQTDHVLRAIQLAKCDLTTQMVQEFTELQGIVGGLYAAAQGEPQEVAAAIYDQYKPVNMEDSLPRGMVGAVVSLAEKIDGVAGGFAAGLAPTGSSDPFALRRAGNGIIKIILEYPLPVGLDLALKDAVEILRSDGISVAPHVADDLEGFMRDRLGHYLENVLNLRHDTVRAVRKAKWALFEPVKQMACAVALEKIRLSGDFLSLSRSANRTRNILQKSAKASDWQGGKLETERLEAGPELDLYDAYKRVREQWDNRRAAGDYNGAFESIASLRPQVDLFFDRILVMAEDPEIRRNRLQLLLELDRLFREDADLSEIEAPQVSDVDTPTLETATSGR